MTLAGYSVGWDPGAARQIEEDMARQERKREELRKRRVARW